MFEVFILAPNIHLRTIERDAQRQSWPGADDDRFPTILILRTGCMTIYYTAHLPRKDGFDVIIRLRSNPSSVDIKESIYADDFARSAQKRELLPKAR